MCCESILPPIRNIQVDRNAANARSVFDREVERYRDEYTHGRMGGSMD